MLLSENNKPCLVETTQGFSVSYNNKFLYSKYAPAKSIEAQILSLSILPGTIFLCCSPVLHYGLSLLENKLPENCIILCAEIDEQLIQFNSNYKNENQQIYNNLHITNLSKEEIFNLPIILNKNGYKFSDGTILPPAGTYKRIVRLDMSAAVQFHSEFYNELAIACTNSLMTFWANRITLTKFGRKYSKNFLSNLKNLSETTPIESFIKRINKPIVIFGAGQSFKDGLNLVKEKRNNFYILCVDTALTPLIKNKIIPDGVFIEEAQFIISRAFLGNTNYNFQVFAGLTSLPQINHIVNKKRISYFTTLYTNADFLTDAQKKNILPPSNPPFGSVGLTAVFYGLKFRNNDSIPVYVCGLDFSYSSGFTHTNGAMAHTERLINTTKLQSIHNYNACYNNNSISIIDKNKNKFFTNQAMINYSKMFNSFFSNEKSLFDIGTSGITLSIPQISINSINDNIIGIENDIQIKSFSDIQKKGINEYISSEKKSLILLRDILSGEKKISANEIDIEIKKIAARREYLFLHFPDGYSFQNNLSFLKRIRTEIDYFLKILN